MNKSYFPTRRAYWVLNKENHTLGLFTGRDQFTYEVDLEQCQSGSEVADWIFQVANKTWANDQIVADLVLKLNCILRPQANLCSGGANLTIEDMRKFLEERYNLIRSSKEEIIFW